MASFEFGGKRYALFTSRAHPATVPACIRRLGERAMVWLALAMFVSLFAWGSNYFGWDDPDGKVRLALFTCFVLGALCGFKSKA
jgi:hypothetical protein